MGKAADNAAAVEALGLIARTFADIKSMDTAERMEALRLEEERGLRGDELEFREKELALRKEDVGLRKAKDVQAALEYEETKEFRESKYKEEQEFRLDQYEDELAARYGAENIVFDDLEGTWRRRTPDEGYSLEKTPEYKIQIALNDLQSQREEKKFTLQYEMSKYFDTQKQVSDTRQRITTKYNALDPKHLNTGAIDILDTFDQAKLDQMSDTKKDILVLNEELSQLQSLEQQLSSQAAKYEEMKGDYMGINLAIDPGEFKELLAAYQTTYPGQPVAGLKEAYLRTKPDAAKRFTLTRGVQKESKDKANALFSDLAAQFSIPEFNESLALVEGLEDKESLQSAMIQTIAQFKAGDYSDFLNYIHADKTGQLRSGFYKLAPGAMNAIEKHDEAITRVQEEYEGVEELDRSALVEQFKEEIVGTATNKEAFSIYESYSDKLPGRELKQEFFKHMEESKGIKDLYPEYKEFLDKGEVLDVEPVSQSMFKNVVADYKGPAGTVKETAANIYEALDRIDIGNPNLLEEIGKRTGSLSRQYTLPTGFHMFDTEKDMRHDYSAGKAIFGGEAGWDSPYYDAFYDSMASTYKDFIKEKDPLGPDWLYYGGYPLHEEHVIPEKMLKEFGEGAYNTAVEVADRLGREAQIKEISTILKTKSGEKYQDLSRALRILQGQ